MAELSLNGWWYLGRRKIIERILNAEFQDRKDLKICDAGCGSGDNISLLSRFGEVVGLELDDGIRKEAERRNPGIRFLKWVSPEDLNEKFDLILMTDVLEHIEDDRSAANWVVRHLKKGGCLLLTVPAFDFLWSEMDDVVWHFRRYTRKSLLGLFPLRVIKFSYYNFFLFPVKVLFVFFSRVSLLLRKREKRSFDEIVPKPIDIFFRRVLFFEAFLLGWFRFPFGSGIVFLAKK